jgi:putative cardiolipin synthase
MMRTLSIGLVLAASVLLAACAALPGRIASPPAYALADVDETRLARIASAATPAEKRGLSGFRLLPEGEYALNARLALMRRAEKSLDAQYYLIKNDSVGRLFLRELRNAAQRGVRVRLVVDDLYTGHEEDLLVGLAAHPNVEVRVFNPLPVRGGPLAIRVLLSLHQFNRINHRMHNKLLVADNSFAVSGGRNIADEYFMFSQASNFIDLDVLSSGPVVRELSVLFDSYWNSEQVYPIARVAAQVPEPAVARQRFDALVRDAAPEVDERPQDVLGQTPLAGQLDSGRLVQVFASAKVFADPPEKIASLDRGSIAGTATERTLELFSSAQREVNIVSPYFVPGARGMERIRAAGATDANGRLRVVTNSLGAADEPLVHSGYSRYRLDMLKAGVRIYELSPSLSKQSGRLGNFGKSFGRLHAKAAVIDRRWALIGSLNLDPRSASVNTEVTLAIDSPELAATVSLMAEEALAAGAYRLRLSPDGKRVEWLEKTADEKIIVHTEEPDDSLWRRVKLWLLSKFVWEDLL